MTADPLADLRDAKCSDGAPSARNLIVTAFGDGLLRYGVDTEVSVQQLAQLLATFGVNERLVRTSLSRLVNEQLLAARQVDRRSSYRVDAAAVALFREADDRIYHALGTSWDGSWTMVVVDGTEGTAAERATLRQELAWAGLGVVAPNVMASPVVDPAVAAAVVSRVGTFENVLVSRSQVIEAAGTIGAEELARRSAPLERTADGYAGFVDRFGHFDASHLGRLDGEQAFKLRTLLVATFRRIVLADPLVPAELLPGDWIGDRARAVAAELYTSIAAASEAFLSATVGLDTIDPPTDRFDAAPAGR